MRKLWIAVTVLLLLGIWLGHAAVLRGIGRLLVVEQPPPSVQYVCLRCEGHGPAGDRAYAEAAAMYRSDPSRRTLLIEPRPDTVVQIGVLPTFEALSRKELSARGVPPEAVILLPGKAEGDWAEARGLGNWLRKQ